jgi:pilus assembly protein Flp/PilA
MNKVWSVLRQLAQNEEGAALIEYTVLVGILLVAAITTIGLVGTWVSGEWTALNKALPA